MKGFTFYVCEKCHEWFWKKKNCCPKCNGKLIPTCPYCGNEIKKCKCTDESRKNIIEKARNLKTIIPKKFVAP